MALSAVHAQDARGRVTSTIVADALAQLPAETPDNYNQIMGELAATGSEGIQMLGSMLKPAAEGVKNSTIEYALNGVAAYVSKDHEALRGGVREGLKAAVAKAGDNPNKAFLMTTPRSSRVCSATTIWATSRRARWRRSAAPRTRCWSSCRTKTPTA